MTSETQEKLLGLLRAGVPVAGAAKRVGVSRARAYQIREALIAAGELPPNEEAPLRDHALPRVRVTRAERRQAERNAKAAGVTLVEFIRRRVL